MQTLPWRVQKSDKRLRDCLKQIQSMRRKSCTKGTAGPRCGATAGRPLTDGSARGSDFQDRFFLTGVAAAVTASGVLAAAGARMLLFRRFSK